VHLHGHRLPSEKICNGYASDTCFAKAKPFRLKKLKKKKPDFEILTGIFDSQKKPSEKKKPKFGFKNAKLATLHATSDCMRPPLSGRGNCCVTRPGIRPT